MPHELVGGNDSERIQALKERLSGFETEAGRRSGLRYKPRRGDVFITTSPKCGTTWMQQIVHQLRTGGSMDFREVSEVVPWIELAADLDQDLEAEQVAAPRAFKTHCWFRDCPYSPESRYIVVVRDPHDVAISFYKFFSGWFFAPGEISLEAFVREFWLARGVPPTEMQNPSYFHHLLSWWEHRADANVLWLHFEDLKEDLRGCVERVADFIGLPTPPTPALIDKVVEMASFEFMRDHQQHFDECLSKEKRNAACKLPADAGRYNPKVRDGEAGSGKVALSPELRQAISERWQATVGEATGCDSYAAFRAMANAELRK